MKHMHTLLPEYQAALEVWGGGGGDVGGSWGGGGGDVGGNWGGMWEEVGEGWGWEWYVCEWLGFIYLVRRWSGDLAWIRYKGS